MAVPLALSSARYGSSGGARKENFVPPISQVIVVRTQYDGLRGIVAGYNPDNVMPGPFLSRILTVRRIWFLSPGSHQICRIEYPVYVDHGNTQAGGFIHGFKLSGRLFGAAVADDHQFFLTFQHHGTGSV